MTLQEIRKQYPQYDDMADDDLVARMHQKYYNDMPLEDFSSKIGYVPSQKTVYPNDKERNVFGGIVNLNPVSALQNYATRLEQENKLMTSGDPKTATQIGMERALSFAPLTMGVAKGSRIFNKQLTPEMQARIDLSEELGVPLTAAEVTQKKLPSLMESAFDKNIASSNVAQKFRESQRGMLDAAREKVQKIFGGKNYPLEAGQIFQEAGKERYRAFMRKAGQIYQSVPVDPTAPIPTETLKEVASNYIDDIGKVSMPAVKRILKVVEESMTPETTITSPLLSRTGQAIQTTIPSKPTYNWKQLLDDQSALRKMAKSTGDFAKKRIYRDLINAMNDDIARYADQVADPTIKSQLDEAVKFYREGDAVLPGINSFRDRQIYNALNSNSPEDIVKKFFKPDNVSDITRLRKVAGDEGIQPLKQAWVEQLFTKGEEQSFSPLKFSTAFNRYDKNTLNAFLSAEEYKGLKQLAEISRIAQSAERMAGNPSGTAQVGGTLYTMWQGITHPIITLSTMLGSNRFANLYFNNPEFRKLLIYGTNPTASYGRVNDVTKRLLALSGLEVQEQQ